MCNARRAPHGRSEYAFLTPSSVESRTALPAVVFLRSSPTPPTGPQIGCPTWGRTNHRTKQTLDEDLSRDHSVDGKDMNGRGCYGLAPRAAMALCRKRQAKATKCNPATVS